MRSCPRHDVLGGFAREMMTTAEGRQQVLDSLSKAQDAGMRANPAAIERALGTALFLGARKGNLNCRKCLSNTDSDLSSLLLVQSTTGPWETLVSRTGRTVDWFRQRPSNTFLTLWQLERSPSWSKSSCCALRCVCMTVHWLHLHALTLHRRMLSMRPRSPSKWSGPLP
jgi:hypothetical protein